MEPPYVRGALAWMYIPPYNVVCIVVKTNTVHVHVMQVYRLLNEVDLALADLDKAINLSKGHGKVAEKSFVQRGLIRRLRGDDEGALADFKSAANLGSRFARKQVSV